MQNKGFPRTIRGRTFTETDIQMIRTLLQETPDLNRRQLSLAVCQRLSWKQPNGRWKDRACRVVLLTLHREEIIELPPPQRVYRPAGRGVPWTAASEMQPTLELPAKRFMPIRLECVSSPQERPGSSEKLWNELIDRYHFLGYRPIVGPQLKYLIFSPLGLVGCIGFGAAAWQIAPRDSWIGWTPEQRKRKLSRIVNNGRFLLLPWIRAKNLASHILSRCLRRLPEDWSARYGYRPLLVETFVHRDRHKGTCYQAANWLRLGETTGRGKWNPHQQAEVPVKLVYVYPLIPDPRQILCGDETERHDGP